MNIPYASRSEFMAACKDAITAQRAKLDAAQLITVFLKPGGYPAEITVTIHASNSTEFEADWSASDPTRFPARVKAAATALRECGSLGRFEISHSNGVLSISKTIQKNVMAA